MRPKSQNFRSRLAWAGAAGLGVRDRLDEIMQAPEYRGGAGSRVAIDRLEQEESHDYRSEE
jgi:hypothetical protein